MKAEIIYPICRLCPFSDCVKIFMLGENSEKTVHFVLFLLNFGVAHGAINKYVLNE